MRPTPTPVAQSLSLAFRLKPIRSVQSQADSGVPTFKATAKPNKTIMFSVACSGTENSKSSALPFDCVSDGGCLGNPGYPDLVGKFDEKIRETPIVENPKTMTIITLSQVRFVEIRKQISRDRGSKHPKSKFLSLQFGAQPDGEVRNADR